MDSALQEKKKKAPAWATSTREHCQQGLVYGRLSQVHKARRKNIRVVCRWPSDVNMYTNEVNWRGRFADGYDIRCGHINEVNWMGLPYVGRFFRVITLACVRGPGHLAPQLSTTTAFHRDVFYFETTAVYHSRAKLSHDTYHYCCSIYHPTVYVACYDHNIPPTHTKGDSESRDSRHVYTSNQTCSCVEVW